MRKEEIGRISLITTQLHFVNKPLIVEMQRLLNSTFIHGKKCYYVGRHYITVQFHTMHNNYLHFSLPTRIQVKNFKRRKKIRLYCFKLC